MNIICLEEKAFFALIDTVITRIKDQNKISEDKWLSSIEAMRKLRITSKTTLQKLRDEGKIRFTQPEKKIILYDSDSINEFLDKHSKNPF